MTWLNPPPEITQLRSQLLLCTSLTGSPLYITTEDIHYPQMQPGAQDEDYAVQTLDSLPAIVLVSEQVDRPKYAEGAAGVFNGTLYAVIWADTVSCPDIGLLESIGRQVLLDLSPPNQYFGFNFQNMRVRKSSDLKPGQQAAQQTQPKAGNRSIVVELTVGLNRGRS